MRIHKIYKQIVLIQSFSIYIKSNVGRFLLGHPVGELSVFQVYPQTADQFILVMSSVVSE